MKGKRKHLNTHTLSDKNSSDKIDENFVRWSDTLVQKSGKNRIKFKRFQLGKENFARDKILSDMVYFMDGRWSTKLNSNKI